MLIVYSFILLLCVTVSEFYEYMFTVVRMSWIRVVWVEGNKEEEGTVRDIWVDSDFILWPPVMNSLKYLKDRKKPTYKWKKFPLVKIKMKSGKNEMM